MATPLSDPAFYFVRKDGEMLNTVVQMPDERRPRSAFMVFSTVAKAERYARLGGRNFYDYDLEAFETLEDVQRFVSQHGDRYDSVMINPELDQPSAVEPLERLLEMAHELAVDE